MQDGYGFYNEVKHLVDAGAIPAPPVEDTVKIPQADFYWDGLEWSLRVLPEYGPDGSGKAILEPTAVMAEYNTNPDEYIPMAANRARIPWGLVLIGIAYLALKRR